MSDKQRAEFEKKAEHLGLDVRWSVCDSDYADGKTSDFWHIWQAALSSVVVDIKNLKSASYTSSGVVYISDVADAIEKAGVKHNDE